MEGLGATMQQCARIKEEHFLLALHVETEAPPKWHKRLDRIVKVRWLARCVPLVLMRPSFLPLARKRGVGCALCADACATFHLDSSFMHWLVS